MKNKYIAFMFMRNAGTVQETCITADRLPCVGGKNEKLD